MFWVLISPHFLPSTKSLYISRIYCFIILHTFSLWLNSGGEASQGNFSIQFRSTYSLVWSAQLNRRIGIQNWLWTSIISFRPEPVHNFWKNVLAVVFRRHLPPFSLPENTRASPNSSKATQKHPRVIFPVPIHYTRAILNHCLFFVFLSLYTLLISHENYWPLL